MRPDARSDAAAAWRPWYWTGRWKRLRRVQLAAHPLCRHCQARGLVVAATVVDHVVPHKGDQAMFWDQANLQSLCAPCHDQGKQVEERKGFNTGVDALGYPIDPRHPAAR